MKLKHNKKRNTAFIYEVLIKELSKASMKNENQKKQKAIKLLKKYFTKNSTLRESLQIYNSFNGIDMLNENSMQKLISEARYQASRLNKSTIFNEQTRLINEINKEFGQDSWETFIKDYKKIATIDQVVFGKTSPKKQIFLEQKLVDILKTSPAEKQPFPNVNKLALKNFLEKFNDEYKDSLNENQKTLLKKYVSSTQEDDSELKIYLYNEIDRLKSCLEENATKKTKYNQQFKNILERITDYSNKKIDKNMITEVIKIQSLVGELTNDTTN